MSLKQVRVCDGCGVELQSKQGFAITAGANSEIQLTDLDGAQMATLKMSGDFCGQACIIQWFANMITKALTKQS